jgi:hypothetical protein
MGVPIAECLKTATGTPRLNFYARPLVVSSSKLNYSPCRGKRIFGSRHVKGFLNPWPGFEHCVPVETVRALSNIHRYRLPLLPLAVCCLFASRRTVTAMQRPVKLQATPRTGPQGWILRTGRAVLLAFAVCRFLASFRTVTPMQRAVELQAAKGTRPKSYPFGSLLAKGSSPPPVIFGMFVFAG